jgi:hypothetical protein
MVFFLSRGDEHFLCVQKLSQELLPIRCKRAINDPGPKFLLGKSTAEKAQMLPT